MEISGIMARCIKDFNLCKWVKILLSSSANSQICNRCSLDSWISSSSNRCLQVVAIRSSLSLKYILLQNSKSFMEFHQNVLRWFLIMVSNNLTKDHILAADKQSVNREWTLAKLTILRSQLSILEVKKEWILQAKVSNEIHHSQIKRFQVVLQHINRRLQLTQCTLFLLKLEREQYNKLILQLLLESNRVTSFMGLETNSLQRNQKLCMMRRLKWSS